MPRLSPFIILRTYLPFHSLFWPVHIFTLTAELHSCTVFLKFCTWCSSGSVQYICFSFTSHRLSLVVLNRRGIIVFYTSLSQVELSDKLAPTFHLPQYQNICWRKGNEEKEGVGDFGGGNIDEEWISFIKGQTGCQAHSSATLTERLAASDGVADALSFTQSILWKCRALCKTWLTSH